MKFLMTYAPTSSAPPDPATMAAIGKFSEEMARSGVLLMTGGLQRPSKGTFVKLAGDEFTVTDGPFVETKELIDGFALIEVKTKEEALEVARRFMAVAGDGTGEILQVFEQGEVPSPRGSGKCG
jgi:hypothetical protein